MSARSSNKPDSPEKYIRTRARSLPLVECYINTGWKDSGMAQCYELMGRDKEAVKVYEELLTLNLGDTYRLGQPDEAAFYLMDYLDLWVRTCK